jgi:DNA-binding FadR family transcriptional regulator
VARHYAGDPVSAGLARLIRELGVGARLPGERDLAIELGVSRTALRDRLQLMEGLGVLRRATGSGTYVQSLDPTGLALALDIALSSSQLPATALNSVRVALERQAAIEAARLRDPVLVAYMEKALQTIEVAPGDDDVDEADYRFHDALLRASGNPALAFFADALSSVLHAALEERRLRMRSLPNQHEHMVAAHTAIHRAIAAGDPEHAAAAVDEHFALYDQLVGKQPTGEVSPRRGTSGGRARKPE